MTLAFQFQVRPKHRGCPYFLERRGLYNCPPKNTHNILSSTENYHLSRRGPRGLDRIWLPACPVTIRYCCTLAYPSLPGPTANSTKRSHMDVIQIEDKCEQIMEAGTDLVDPGMFLRGCKEPLEQYRECLMKNLKDWNGRYGTVLVVVICAKI